MKKKQQHYKIPNKMLLWHDDATKITPLGVDVSFKLGPDCSSTEWL